MATRKRTDALTRARIVDAAIAVLDADEEAGLTFRALSQALATGPGAIYHHVSGKGELLDAATEAVVTAALDLPGGGAAPREEVHALALGLFDAIDDHPWVAAQLAAQLARTSAHGASLRILEALGRRVMTLGVPREHWFTTTTALLYYVLGAAGQNAAARESSGGDDRAAVLAREADAWESLPAEDFPFLRAVAAQMRDHDDREQFTAGVDLVLAGIAASGARVSGGSAR
ncbi:TetR family transcriptional regulator [Actinokineospora bangkokensis]|uniref:TetR family transcriptional regulator n=1 Tax=Actinokineospora bangkokensis TaxID=1193682 RepID=A0A1Q9LRC8_9PSEU|nr:TetR family transcriptional regulator [Actinokineospora bangkokensis]